MIYELKCTPQGEDPRVVSIDAASITEAVQRAERIWVRQEHTPLLLAIVDREPQKALAF